MLVNFTPIRDDAGDVETVFVAVQDLARLKQLQRQRPCSWPWSATRCVRRSPQNQGLDDHACSAPADRARIAQVLHELFSNTARYWPDSVPIHVGGAREGIDVAVSARQASQRDSQTAVVGSRSRCDPCRAGPRAPYRARITGLGPGGRRSLTAESAKTCSVSSTCPLSSSRVRHRSPRLTPQVASAQ